MKSTKPPQTLTKEQNKWRINPKMTLAVQHYLEEGVWAKTPITYLDKLSEEPNHGA